MVDGPLEEICQSFMRGVVVVVVEAGCHELCECHQHEQRRRPARHTDQ
jgi:hypothetical protein